MVLSAPGVPDAPTHSALVAKATEQGTALSIDGIERDDVDTAQAIARQEADRA